jgi:hypothetical protein
MPRKLRCPTTSRGPDDLVGCGSTNIQGPDTDGTYDCLDCGLWFTAEAGEYTEEA